MISEVIALQAYGYMKYELNGYRLIEYNMFVDHERKWKGYHPYQKTAAVPVGLLCNSVRNKFNGPRPYAAL